MAAQATVSSKNIPNVSPKEIFTYFENSYLLIANIASPQSVHNIKENEKVCVSFIDIFIQKGFQIKGSAIIIKRSQKSFYEKIKPLTKLAGNKFPIASIIEVKISEIKPIIAPKYMLYPETTDEEQIESALKTYKVQRKPT